MFIGINGLGRIGKCILIQLINEPKSHIQVKAINIPGFDIKNIEQYLMYDSTHSYSKENWDIKVIDDSSFSINGRVIYVLNNRDASQLNWRSHDVNYVIDSTGAYLTTDACMKHNVDYVVMCAPPKDNSDQFVFNVNHTDYRGQRVVSNASCTTNAITPVLRVLEDSYGLSKANFTTIHSMTASQNTIDTNNFSNRTSRSISGNIIPHSTGANKSITKLMPTLKDRVVGTSLRVPTINVSIVDLNVTLNENEEDMLLEDVMNTMIASGFIKVSKLKLVSSDYTTTTTPAIVDYSASMKLCGKNEFKIMIWYDNEWAYCAQAIRLIDYMVSYNEAHSPEKNKFYIENYNFKSKNVVMRVDWNIPTDNHIIQDSYRITSSLKSIEYVLNNEANKIVIVSHLGRPDPVKAPEKMMQYSWGLYVEQLQKFFDVEKYGKIHFLANGCCQETLTELSESSSRIYLLENIRFHKEETHYEKEDFTNSEVVKVFNQLGDFYVNDAFGCCHRAHMSIVGMNRNIPHAYGYLIDKELKCLELINKNKNQDKILAIIGGGKMHDKLELLKNLSKKVDGIYIAGGNINSLAFDKSYSTYLENLKDNKASIHLMKDGLASRDLNSHPVYQSVNIDNINPDDEQLNYFDIGMESIIELNNLLQQYDTIFWNGTLGVVENTLYSYGSTTLVQLLIKSGKKIIVGGGDTAGFVQKFPHNFHFVSTGGGASIDYISNGFLAGTKYFDDDEAEVRTCRAGSFS